MSKAVSFVREAYSELKKVSWPSRKQTMNYTVAVIVASIAVAAFLGSLDKFFSSIVERILF
jgi:preprotein translocase subunit SecE